MGGKRKQAVARIVKNLKMSPKRAKVIAQQEAARKPRKFV